MRSLLAAAIVIGLLAGAGHAGDEKTVPSSSGYLDLSEPLVRAVRLFHANDEAGLAALAAESWAWDVAEDLLLGGRADIAGALARASKQNDAPALRAYVSGFEERGPNEKTGVVWRDAVAAFGRKDRDGAIALLQGLDPGARDVLTLRLRYARGESLTTAGRRQEAADVYAALAAPAEEIGWLHLAADTLNRAGMRLAELRETDRALRCWDRALVLSEKGGDLQGLVFVLQNCASGLQRNGRIAEAQQRLDRALAITREHTLRRSEATVLTNLGALLGQQGRLELAMAHFEQALAILEEVGEHEFAAVTLANMAQLLSNRGRGSEADRLYHQALEQSEKAANPRLESGLRRAIADLAHNRGDLEAALEGYLRARAIAERAGLLREAILSLAGIAGIHVQRGDLRKGLPLLEQCLGAAEGAGDVAQVSILLSQIAACHVTLGDLERAADALRRAQAAAEAAGDPVNRALAQVRLAHVEMQRGRTDEALTVLEQARATFTATQHAPGLAEALELQGQVHVERAEFERARAAYDAALRIYGDAGSRVGIVTCLTSIGALHLQRGAYDDALAILGQALAASERAGAPVLKSQCLAVMSQVHQARGDVAKALACRDRQLAVARASGNRFWEADTLGSIGSLLHAIGDLERALDCQQKALAILETTDHRAATLLTLGNVGVVLGSLGRKDEARASQERLLAGARAAKDKFLEAHALSSLAGLENLQDPAGLAKSIALVEAALALYEAVGDRSSQARELCRLGRGHAVAGRTAEARTFLDRGIELAREVGDLRAEVNGLQDLAEVSLMAGDAAGALAAARTAEKRLPLLVRHLADRQAASARQSYERLFQSGLSAGLALGDAGAAFQFLESGRAGGLLEALGGRAALTEASIPPELVAGERDARVRVGAARAALRRAHTTGERKASRDALRGVKKAEEALIAAIERIQREAKQGADVAYPSPAPLADVRATLAGGEAFVAFGESLDGLVAIVVRPAAARLVPFGPAPEIHAAFEALDLSDAAADPQEALSTLRARLVAPLKLDDGVRRVLISPTGVLGYVPFSLLFEGREVVCVPSGTTLRLLRSERADPGRGVLALGDPDYGVTGPANEAAKRASATRAGLVALPATRKEVEAIGDVVLLGREANETALAEAVARRKRWRALHFACHGLVDGQRPLLSALALTPTSDSDGFLTVIETMRLDLPADLVVLSACETGRGTTYEAEGIMGLTRAFMLAGTPRVIASLWKVDDEATRALMTKFYESWSPEEGEGLGAAAALEAAQAFVRSHEKWEHPYYWAAWVLWGLP